MDPATPSPPSSSSPPPSPRPKRVARWPDWVFYGLVFAVGLGIIGIALAIIGVLAYNAQYSFRVFGWPFIWSETWNVHTQVFGALPFIAGTLVTSAIALLIAVPLALGSAIFITTQAPRILRGPVGTAIELLAAVPSVIYGLWGIFVLHPYMETTVEPGLQHYLGWTGLFTGPTRGFDVLTAGIVLAIMVVPTVCAVSRDTLLAVPDAQKEAALSLGATNWETTRVAMLPYARTGILGGTILGLGRALGETMAVLMVIGDVDKVPTSLFSPAQTIATLIANEFLSSSGTLQTSAILYCALILMAIALGVNIAARLLVWRISRSGGGMTIY